MAKQCPAAALAGILYRDVYVVLTAREVIHNYFFNTKTPAIQISQIIQAIFFSATHR